MNQIRRVAVASTDPLQIRETATDAGQPATPLPVDVTFTDTVGQPVIAAFVQGKWYVLGDA